jgi:hypothetical protein
MRFIRALYAIYPAALRQLVLSAFAQSHEQRHFAFLERTRDVECKSYAAAPALDDRAR